MFFIVFLKERSSLLTLHVKETPSQPEAAHQLEILKTSAVPVVETGKFRPELFFSVGARFPGRCDFWEGLMSL